MVNLVQWMLYQIGNIRQAQILSQRSYGYELSLKCLPPQPRQLALAAGKFSIYVRRLRSVSMRLRVLSSLLLLFFTACQLAAQATSNAQKFSPPTRTCRFTYNFTVTSQRREKRSRKKIIFSAALTPIACSYPSAATSHCLLSRMVQRSITSSTRMSR